MEAPVVTASPNWICGVCGSHDGFTATVDKILHVTRGHVGVVMAPDSEKVMQNVQYDTNKKRWM